MLRTYYHDTLTNAERDGYYAIDNAVRYYRTDCMLYGVDKVAAERIVAAYIYDNPGSWHCLMQFIMYAPVVGGTRLIFTYNGFDESLFNERMSEITGEIDDRIGPYPDEERIIRTVYDYLAENVAADHDLMAKYAELNRVHNGDIPQAEKADFIRDHGASFSAYGAIVNRKAACMGIASAYKLLLDTYRVEAACVPGIFDNTPHMINVVEIGGVRAFVDLTRGLYEKEFPMIRYNAFLVNEERIRTYFAPDTQFDCTTNHMSLYHKNGLAFKDGSSLRRYLSSFTYHATNGNVMLWYTGDAFDEDLLKKMVEDIAYPRCGSEYKILGYTVDKGIINIKMDKSEKSRR